MCTVLLPPGANPIAVNKYIMYYFVVELLGSTVLWPYIYSLSVGAVVMSARYVLKSSIINRLSVVHLLVHYANNKDARYKC